jgi:hypothetical protein
VVETLDMDTGRRTLPDRTQVFSLELPEVSRRAQGKLVRVGRVLATYLCQFHSDPAPPVQSSRYRRDERGGIALFEKSPKVRAEYLHYLEEILESRKQNDIVTDGIAYFHFRDTVIKQNLICIIVSKTES